MLLDRQWGMHIFHHAFRSPITHYNIKFNNIFLDDNHNPKVVDYGLANLTPILDRYTLSSKIQSVWSPIKGARAPRRASHGMLQACNRGSGGSTLLHASNRGKRALPCYMHVIG